MSFGESHGVHLKSRQVITKVMGKNGRFNRFSDVVVQNRRGVLKLLDVMMGDNDMGYSRKRVRYEELRQSLKGSSSVSPAIATPTGVNV